MHKLRRLPHDKGSRRGGRGAAAACAFLLLAGAGGVWAFRDSLFGGRTGGPNAAPGNAEIPMSVEVSGESGDGARAHNAGMAGMYAFDGQTVYKSDGGTVVDGDGNIVYSGTFYGMNANDGVLYGINSRGEIIAVAADGSEQIIRSAGYPSRLTLSGGALYFIEDGLFRVDLSGGGETQLTADSPDTFAVSGGAAYYIGGDARLWRADGGEPVVALDRIVDYFCFDREQLYFTAAGSGDLYIQPPDGEPRLVSGSMRGLFSPRFAVNGDYLYFGEPGGGVYRTPLSGGATETLRGDGCVAFYLLPSGVYCLEDLPSALVYALTDQQ